MSTHIHTINEAEKGLPDGLGAENTQPGPDVTHVAEGDSLEFGLGSPETQHEHTS